MSGNIFYVYEHWRPDTGVCFYVGKGKKRRAWIMTDRNSHHSAIVSKLISMGMQVDVRLVISEISEDTAFAVEQDLIAKYGRKNLANQTDGGDGVSGFKMPESAKIKMRAAKIGRPGNITMLGRKHTPETRAKMSMAHKGKPKSPEHIAKVAAAHKGKKVVHTLETKMKMSVTRRGKKLSPHHVETIRLAWKRRKEAQGGKS